MIYKFYDLAFVSQKYGDFLRRTINYNEVLKKELIQHLAEIYEKEHSAFQEYSDFAFMDTRFHDLDGNKLYAFFTENTIKGAKQKWYCHGFKTENEIESLCNPDESETEEESQKSVKKRIIQDAKTIFDTTPLTTKSSVKTLLDMYRKEHAGNDNRDGVIFERMLIQAIIENDSPNCICNDETLLDEICVDDYYDSGIDGICIRVNGHIITSLDMLTFVINSDKTINSAEIILIQSKCKDSFDLKEVSTFILGVQNFLEPVSSRKLNSKVQKWFDIKNEILESIQYWNEMSHIKVRLFYAAANATWNNSSEILGSFETLKKGIERFENGIYQIDSPVFIDEKRLQKIAVNDNENISVKIESDEQLLQLSGNESVMGCAAVISASELLKILIDETTGNLKRGLFEENVRDYQGNTNVNLSIKETIKTAPESFILRNNGITILANRLEYPNLKSIRITNPQIVNGCQTCSVIYYAYKDGLDVSKVKIFARIISTNETETINSIVSANNNQNQVHDMINEITKEYHKKLELFFRNYDETSEQKHVYYERRSKSLAQENICGYQRCTFRTMIQSAVAVWFESPYEAIGSEQVLLSKYRNQVFSDNQKEICYYASASLYSAFDRVIYQNRLDASWRSAKPFICFIIKKSICNEKIFLNDTEKAVDLAGSILNLVRKDAEYIEALEKALQIYSKAKELFKSANKNKNMSDYLNSNKIMSYIIGAMSETGKSIKDEKKPSAVTYTGKITRVGRDRNGAYYLFINTGMTSMFAHQNFSPDTPFNSLQSGQTIIYEIDKDIFGKDVAVRLRR